MFPVFMTASILISSPAFIISSHLPSNHFVTEPNVYLYIYSEASRKLVQVKNGKLNARGQKDRHSVFIKEVMVPGFFRLRSNETKDYVCLHQKKKKFIMKKQHHNSALCLMFQDISLPTRYISAYDQKSLLAFTRKGALRHNRFLKKTTTHRSVLFNEYSVLQDNMVKVCKYKLLNDDRSNHLDTEFNILLRLFSRSSRKLVQVRNDRLDARGRKDRYSVFIKEAVGSVLFRLRLNETKYYVCLHGKDNRFIMQKQHHNSALCLMYKDILSPTRYISAYDQQSLLAFTRKGALRHNKFLKETTTHRSVLFHEHSVTKNYLVRVCDYKPMNDDFSLDGG